MDLDNDKIDEAVLALMCLTRTSEKVAPGRASIGTR